MMVLCAYSEMKQLTGPRRGLGGDKLGKTQVWENRSGEWEVEITVVEKNEKLGEECWCKTCCGFSFTPDGNTLPDL